MNLKIEVSAPGITKKIIDIKILDFWAPIKIFPSKYIDFSPICNVIGIKNLDFILFMKLIQEFHT